MTDPCLSRRSMVISSVSAGAGLLLACGGNAALAASPADADEGGEGVAPPEDLMREHGVLNRILLVYEECARRIEASTAPPPIDALAKSASIAKRFIEDYHEHLEEDHLFPRFERANVLADLVATLRRQHRAGRVLTDRILKSASSMPSLQDADARKGVVAPIYNFVRMYRPHEAREDTVLFPALRKVVSKKEFEDLGEQFEDKEHQLFGKAGFEGIVDEVAQIERGLGLYDLDQFTPV